MCRWHHLYGRKRRTKEPLDESERGEWKSSLKAQHSKTKMMTSGPITSWEIDGETIWDTLFPWTPKSLQVVTASMKLKVWKKIMTNLDILKSREITLSTEVRLVKAMVFPVVVYGCESWTIKKAEHRRIDAFEPWCWKRLLWVPWTARRSNQPILKEISPKCSLEGLKLEWSWKLKLKLQYFGHLMRRADSSEKTLMLEKIEGRRRRGQ